MKIKILRYLEAVLIFVGLGFFGCILTNNIPVFLAFYNGGLALFYLWEYMGSVHDKRN